MVLMTENRLRHLPVMDGDTLLGLISIGDLVKDIISEQNSSSSSLSTTSPASGADHHALAPVRHRAGLALRSACLCCRLHDSPKPADDGLGNFPPARHQVSRRLLARTKAAFAALGAASSLATCLDAPRERRLGLARADAYPACCGRLASAMCACRFRWSAHASRDASAQIDPAFHGARRQRGRRVARARTYRRAGHAPLPPVGRRQARRGESQWSG